MSEREREAEQAFYQIGSLIRCDANYIPRGYVTRGGMWTRDTWRLGDVEYCLEDEGWTSLIRTTDGRLHVYQSGKDALIFKAGDEAQLIELAAALAALHDHAG